MEKVHNLYHAAPFMPAGHLSKSGWDGICAVIQREFHALQSEKFIADTFQGSLPAFSRRLYQAKKLTDQEIRELEELIHQKREE